MYKNSVAWNVQFSHNYTVGHYERNILYFFTREKHSRFKTLKACKLSIETLLQTLAYNTQKSIAGKNDDFSPFFSALEAALQAASTSHLPFPSSGRHQNRETDPIEIVLPASLRNEIFFPPRIVADVVFNKLYISLRGEEDSRELENSVKRYLFDCIDCTVWQLLIGERAAELLESGAGDLRVLRETLLYKRVQSNRKNGTKVSGSTLFTTNKLLKAVTTKLLARGEEQQGMWYGQFQALDFRLSYRVFSLPAVDVYKWYKTFLQTTRRTAAAVSRSIRTLADILSRFTEKITSLATIVSSVGWKTAFQLVLIPVLLLVIVGETSPVFYPKEDKTKNRSALSFDATVELEKARAQPIASTHGGPVSVENGLNLVASYQGKSAVLEGMGIYYFEDSTVNFGNKIHLTFDDGPNLAVIDEEENITVTERILDILKPLHITATFFINGKNLLDEHGRPLLLAERVMDRMIREDHSIANHSYSHHNLSGGDYNDGEHDIEEIKEEIIRTQTALDALLGYHYPMRYFRPPYAEAGRNEKVDQAVRELGMEMIIFQIDSFDYRMQSAKRLDELTILNKIEKSIEKSTGGVVLLHDREKTAALLPDILRTCTTTENEAGIFTQSSLFELLRMKYGLLKDF
jgi:peptidoglycan/xylan/chitin deacetylase (PgdA/CDA1 family)